MQLWSDIDLHSGNFFSHWTNELRQMLPFCALKGIDVFLRLLVFGVLKKRANKVTKVREWRGKEWPSLIRVQSTWSASKYLPAPSNKSVNAKNIFFFSSFICLKSKHPALIALKIVLSELWNQKKGVYWLWQPPGGRCVAGTHAGVTSTAYEKHSSIFTTSNFLI